VRSFARPLLRLAPKLGALLLGAGLVCACGGSSSGSGPGTLPAPTAQAQAAPDGGSGGLSVLEPDRPTSTKDAARLLDQASFGPSDDALTEAARQGARKYLLTQMDEPVSRYTYATSAGQRRAAIHTSGSKDFCQSLPAAEQQNCWRDYFSSLPVQWEFFRHAVANPDQLRQRLAFALSQIMVTSDRELDGTYGFADYHQMLRDHAFASYRTLLEKVITSPFMGAYLNMADNDPADPNENFAREMLQLFSIGACELNEDGSLKGGKCVATYSNEIVRNYAFSLTGWTYPAGGADPWCDSNCSRGRWTNPRHYRGQMVAKASHHDQQPRALLSGVVAGANRTPQQGLAAVLDSIMAHPNIGPFVGRQLIQFFVTSNPSPTYTGRVARAFRSGIYTDASGSIGSGEAGDMRAVMAAVLLDAEARNAERALDTSFGRLREPVQYLAGALRAADGLTDGNGLVADWGWSGQMNQAPFHSPSVFNYYPPDFPLVGTSLVAPQFGIDTVGASLKRINFANALFYWWSDQGTPPDASMPNAMGTRVNYSRWEALIDSPAASARLVERLNEMLVGGRLGPVQRQAIVTAMDEWTPDATWLESQSPPSSWQRERVKTALYLILASPHYHVQR
jgi:uncharacterized protein (DUF1800 family)